ncbi:MAG: S-layer homology domain-containing protein [Clostridiales bacterium]|nr:S-layer homology domain-containing protein [Clostridiales bacterium]
MLNRTGRISAALIGALLFGMIGIPAGTVSAAGGVKIDGNNFPDKNFRTVVSNYDSNNDGSLSSAEIKKITYLSLGNKVSNLKGLEKLTEVTYLYLNQSSVKTLDVSANKKLATIYATKGKLTSITGLEKAADLRTLNVQSNSLTSLDVSKNENLQTLYCSENKLTSLNVSNNRNLKNLYCGKNKIGSLDLTNCVSLNSLSASDNALTELKLPKQGTISGISCANNNLTELDVSDYPYITTLSCSGNKIKSLDVSQCINMLILSCYNNELTELKLGRHDKMVYLLCNDNKISSLDLSKAPNVSLLFCSNNELTDLNFRDMPDLKGLSCFGNKTDTAYIDVVAKDTYIIVSEIRGKILESCVTEKLDEDPSSTKIVSEAIKEAGVSSGGGVSTDPKASDGTKFTWKTSSPKVVKVESKADSSASGAELTGVRAGNVTVKCTGGKSVMNYKVRVLYADVTDPTDFWYEPTNELTASGVVNGYEGKTLFRPANKCTRAQMVTFLWRLQGSPAPKTKTCKFSDVKKSDYFYKAVIWGSENNIVEGYKNGTFKPQVVCARKHAVTFMWRLAGKPAPTSANNKFKDVKSSDYYYNAALWASEMNILAGYSDNTFRPNGNCLRRQMVTFLYKYNKYVNGK